MFLLLTELYLAVGGGLTVLVSLLNFLIYLGWGDIWEHYLMAMMDLMRRLFCF